MKLEVEMEDTDAALIKKWLAEQDTWGSETNRPPLDTKALAERLLQDVALALRRPGSWEGANMIEVLRGHGYW